MDLSSFSVKQLMELDACTRCGECMNPCPINVQGAADPYIPAEKIRMLRSVFNKERSLLNRLRGWRRDFSDVLDHLSENTYLCTLCGRCQQVCPVNIDQRSLWISMRHHLVERGHAPEVLDQVKEIVEREHNVLDYPNQERAMWVEFMEEAPDHLYQREKAEVLYFVGCIGSFSPAIQEIPTSFLRVLEAAGEDFVILGEEEWCCGFPLIIAGLSNEAEALREHNLQKLKDLGAKTVVFSCPSCFYTWSNYYQPEGIELLHSTQYMQKLINEGRLELKEIEQVTTYHDPCDLGRGMKVFEPPREVVRAGVKNFVELPQNRERGFCCGGGGDLEMTDAEITNKIACDLLDAVNSTGAEMVVTACQQCKRMLLTSVKNEESPVKVVDIVELVLENGVFKGGPRRDG
jgi:heterodisulfide reductase subunit D